MMMFIHRLLNSTVGKIVKYVAIAFLLVASIWMAFTPRNTYMGFRLGSISQSIFI